MRFEGRLCVLNVESVQRKILDEVHKSTYTIQPVVTKMYHDLMQVYWWDIMKRDVAEYVSRCLPCQQVKAEQQKLAGLLQRLEVPEWKWEWITMDFVVDLPRTPKGCNSI